MKSSGAILLSVLLLGCSKAPTSVYTELNDAACRVVEEDEETGSARLLCPGVGGYQLAILYDDARISIDVLSPDGLEFPLEYWNVISQAFTGHGEKAEWRVIRTGWKKVPVALIVQVDAYEDSENPEVFTSYLAVAKFTPENVCVTDKIPPGPDQKDVARRAANHAASKACLGDNETKSSTAESSASARPIFDCDIWGAGILDEPVLNEDGILMAPYITGPFPEDINNVWRKSFKFGEPQKHVNSCLKSDGGMYGVYAGFHSETEGSFFNYRKYKSVEICKEANYTEQVVPLPRQPLSRKCPVLALGASVNQIEKQFGQAHVQHADSHYYLQDNGAQNRAYCTNWLEKGYDDCCYPGVSLSFSDGKLSEITIHDGGGEGPPCDEHPDSLE